MEAPIRSPNIVATATPNDGVERLRAPDVLPFVPLVAVGDTDVVVTTPAISEQIKPNTLQ